MKSQLAIYDALRGIDVPADKAKAVAEAMESDMGELVTKTYLTHAMEGLRNEMKADLYRALLVQTLALAGLMIAILKLS